MGSQKTRRQFLEYFDEMSSQEADQKYEEYKNEFKRRFGRKFFDKHQNEEWFKEKYDPSYLEKKFLERNEKSKENLKFFKDQLQSNSIDFQLTINGQFLSNSFFFFKKKKFNKKKKKIIGSANHQKKHFEKNQFL